MAAAEVNVVNVKLLVEALRDGVSAANIAAHSVGGQARALGWGPVKVVGGGWGVGGGPESGQTEGGRGVWGGWRSAGWGGVGGGRLG